MGKEIVYCSACGDRIPSTDFEKGRAATIADKHFCRKCVAIVKSEEPQKDNPNRSDESTQLRKSRTQRIPLPNPPKSARSSRLPYIIAGIIGVIVIILILVVIFSRG